MTADQKTVPTWDRESFIAWLLSRGETGVAEWVKKNLPSVPTEMAFYEGGPMVRACFSCGSKAVGTAEVTVLDAFVEKLVQKRLAAMGVARIAEAAADHIRWSAAEFGVGFPANLIDDLCSLYERDKP